MSAPDATPKLRREAGTPTGSGPRRNLLTAVLVLLLLATATGAMVEHYRLELRIKDAEATTEQLLRGQAEREAWRLQQQIDRLDHTVIDLRQPSLLERTAPEAPVAAPRATVAP